MDQQLVICEGLSKIYKPSNSPQLNLKIVEGFVTDGKQFLSGQIDCMLGSW